MTDLIKVWEGADQIRQINKSRPMSVWFVFVSKRTPIYVCSDYSDEHTDLNKTLQWPALDKHTHTHTHATLNTPTCMNDNVEIEPAVPSRQQILQSPEWVSAPGSFLSLLLESSWDELAVLLQMKARAYSQ